MCGFTGLLVAGQHHTEDLERLAALMAMAINHRGPNDAGTWVDSLAGVALGHRRLSIVDLSPAGHQPMISADSSLVLAYNGEIYNHLALRSELDKSGLGSAWRGHSDTETLLNAFSAWGVQATLERCIGMFAFALWNRETCTLTLGRDRLGEKPLYYGWQGQGDASVFLFGSELKALKAHPAFNAGIDRNSLCLLMRHNYIPAPYSIYQGIAKLEAGCLLNVSLEKPEPVVTRYWSGAQVVQTGTKRPFAGSPEQAVDSLELLLKDAVAQQMVADVPLGAFLSGGVDSSTVVALMQAQSAQRIKTFTIGFNENEYNEAVHAKAVAAHLGTDHTELYVTPQQAMDVIPKLPSLYCEPFSDSSQIPTFLVSQLARQQVTVSLSGDGGDELFCGYNRYLFTNNLWNKLSLLPVQSKSWISYCLKSLSPEKWTSLISPINKYLPGNLRMQNPGDKFHKAASVLSAQNIEQLYLKLVSHWQDPADLVINGAEPVTHMNMKLAALDNLSDIEYMMALDLLTYLPDDILVKVDRAGMGVSLESRVPFLDHRVVEFAWTLPQNLKLRENESKWVLRQVLYRHVPKKLIERPKMGFGVPIGDWLRGPLRDWAENLLDETRLRNEGFFHPDPIRKKWTEHLSGSRNWESLLWIVLMFQAWLSENEA